MGSSCGKMMRLKLKPKLVIDKKKEKVIFAEAQKDFVDFLICLINLPLTAVVKYLGAEVPGSIGKLHSSMESIMKAGYFKPFYNIRSNILVPRLSPSVPILPKIREDTCSPKADSVKEKVQYMVADDLSVSPLDFNSVLCALKCCNPGDVVEKEVEFGSSEALALLNASLHSKEPLTTLFLKTEPPNLNI